MCCLFNSIFKRYSWKDFSLLAGDYESLPVLASSRYRLTFFVVVVFCVSLNSFWTVSGECSMARSTGSVCTVCPLWEQISCTRMCWIVVEVKAVCSLNANISKVVSANVLFSDILYKSMTGFNAPIGEHSWLEYLGLKMWKTPCVGPM